LIRNIITLLLYPIFLKKKLATPLIYKSLPNNLKLVNTHQ
jgi:hypothetical protein